MDTVDRSSDCAVVQCGIRGSFPGPCRQKEFLRPSETGAGVVSSHRLCAVPYGTAPTVSDAALQISPALPQTRGSSVSSGPKRATDSRDDDGKNPTNRARPLAWRPQTCGGTL